MFPEQVNKYSSGFYVLQLLHYIESILFQPVLTAALWGWRIAMISISRKEKQSQRGTVSFSRSSRKLNGRVRTQIQVCVSPKPALLVRPGHVCTFKDRIPMVEAVSCFLFHVRKKSQNVLPDDLGHLLLQLPARGQAPPRAHLVLPFSP